MIEITAAAAKMIMRSQAEGKVIRMFLAAIDASGATYGLALGDEEAGDKIFESRGVKVHMSPQDAELLRETIIDYVDDEELGTGFIIRGPEDELSGSGCGSCANADSCDHDHSSCDHDHDDCGCGCGHNHSD
ncbi:MAG: iron-sulfur cluster assembly protein [Methanosaeta sp. PtaU1.Bin112]|nr:MAG: iron-sulfur cluster assembly protein [Methanosaeta sp. PtaU1.Bin112]